MHGVPPLVIGHVEEYVCSVADIIILSGCSASWKKNAVGFECASGS